jgi:hypothetical protein
MTFDITFDGVPVPVRPGETIGAALMRSGHRTLRLSRVDGRPRGVFCGIGVCYDCLVVVAGHGTVRACQRVARPGDEVTRHG